MWLALALAAALFQVLRNTAMQRLGHALDEYINVWGRFTFLLPFALLGCVFAQLRRPVGDGEMVLIALPTLASGFWGWCAFFGVTQTLATLALSKALKLSEISLVTALWKVSLLILLGMAWVTIGEHPSALGVTSVITIKKAILVSDAAMGTFGGYLAASLIMTPIALATSARHFRALPRHWKEFVALGLF